MKILKADPYLAKDLEVSRIEVPPTGLYHVLIFGQVLGYVHDGDTGKTTEVMLT